jgi:2-C-methyl-D-erythritol 4-phosphate cytidylyltransferase
MSASNLTSHISHLTSNYAIIVAGGSGIRMGTTIPKQFLLLNSTPVLMHTISAFHNCKSKPRIILVLHAGFHQYWDQLCNEHSFNVPHTMVRGGETRFHSVKKGLDAVPADKHTIIAVQDAVRPLTSEEVIDESFAYAAKNGNAIAAVKSRDSVRQLLDDHSVSLTRNEIYLVQTPQTFQSAQLKKAYKQDYSESFTDDASVVEQTGVKINLIEGNYRNIKITFPEDIAIAALFLKVHS